MTETTTTSDEKMMQRYLLGELSEAEIERLEESFIADEAVFAEVLEVENELVDRYILKKLAPRELELFEKNYLVTPEKRQKVETARVLQTFLQKQTVKETATAKAKEKEKLSLWQRISNAFASPVGWQYVTAALFLIFSAGFIFLLMDRSRLNDQIADLRENSNQVSPREIELNRELETIRQREADLQKRLAEQNGQSESITKELDEERKERERLEDEIEKLRRQQKQQQNQQNTPRLPEFASATLRPAAGAESSTPASATPVNVPKNVEKIRMNLVLPASAKTEEKFSVEFDGRRISSNLTARTEPVGGKFLRVGISAKNLDASEHEIAVKDATGKIISRYVFRIRAEK